MIHFPVAFPRILPAPRILTTLLAAGVLVLSGCSAPAPLVVEVPEEVEVGPMAWSEVETVDLSEFPETLPVADVRVEHDVPAPLMNSTADDGTIVEVDGFRVQIFSSAEREETADSEDAIRRWLKTVL